MGFWLQLGASGFRVDAAPFVLEQVAARASTRRRRTSRSSTTGAQDLQWRGGDAVLLCEANVAADDCRALRRRRPDGPNDRAHMLFDFLLNPRLWLALARGDAEPLVEALTTPPGCRRWRSGRRSCATTTSST